MSRYIHSSSYLIVGRYTSNLALSALATHAEVSSVFILDCLCRQVLGRLLGPHIVAESVLHVDEAEVAVISDLVDGLEVGFAEGDALEIGLDALGVGALGEHDVAATKTPGNQYLGQGVTALLGNVVQGLVVADALAGRRHLVLRAQRRVGLGHDVLGEAVLHQLLVRQERMDLDLVDLRRYLGEREHLLQLRDGPVGHTDGLGLAVRVQLLHGAPGGLGVFGQVFEDHVLHLVSFPILPLETQCPYLAVRSDLRLLLAVLLGGNGPVDQEQVDVVKLQALE